MPTITGTAGNDTLTGGEENDVLIGLAGDDVLVGGGGDDVLSGGAGRNTLDGGPGNDTVSYLDATSGVMVSLAVSGPQTTGYTLGATTHPAGNSVDTLISINGVIGSAFADFLTGSAGDDVIDPGSRPYNTLQGYQFANANDVVNAGAGNDRISASGVTNGSVFNGEDGDDIIQIDWSAAILPAPGSGVKVLVDGRPVQLNGGAGADRLSAISHAVIDGGDGDDVITVGYGRAFTAAAYDLPLGTDATVRLTGGAGVDTFVIANPVGTAVITDFSVAVDRLDFSNSVQTLASGAARPIYVGQQGADTIFYYRPLDGSTSAETIVARLLNVNSQALLTASVALGGIVQTSNLTFFGSAANETIFRGGNQVFGGAPNTYLFQRPYDVVNAGDGNDIILSSEVGGTLNGEGGDDTIRAMGNAEIIIGGTGYDIADYSGARAAVTVNLGTGVATSADRSGTIAGIEVLTGSRFDDILIGSTGSEILRGGRGLDQLTGGAGGDTFLFEALDSGASTIDSIADFQTGLDILVLYGLNSPPVSLVRVSAAATLLFATQPYMNGRFFDQASTVIGINGVIQGTDVFQADSRFQPVLNLVGWDGSDTWVGGERDDTINGGAGDDFLTGGPGADTLTGGVGRDQFIYTSLGDTGGSTSAIERITDFETGVDVINLNALLPTTIFIERQDDGTTMVTAVYPGLVRLNIQIQGLVQGTDILFSGRTNIPISMIGSSLADWLVGGDGDDIIQGSSGADVIMGGAGADTISGNDGGDVLGGGAGRDVFSYSRAIESNATAFDNLFDFETGVDSISLTFLNPTSVSIIRSDDGSSFVFAETASGAFLTTAAGRAVNGSDITYVGFLGVYMIGSGSADVLTGSSLADPIQGGAGNDTITGGGGADALFGEGGADTFVYRATTDSTVAAADTVFGFVSGQDRIDLSAVRTGASDTFGIAYLNGSSFLFVDLGGNGSNDMLIQLAGTTLVASDIRWSAGASDLEPTLKAAGPEVLPVSDDVDVFWTGLAPLRDDEMLFLADDGPATARGHDWYL